jgi:hypothetical protein
MTTPDEPPPTGSVSLGSTSPDAQGAMTSRPLAKPLRQALPRLEGHGRPGNAKKRPTSEGDVRRVDGRAREQWPENAE